jgi:SAM-dependent methyltransferase
MAVENNRRLAQHLTPETPLLGRYKWAFRFLPPSDVVVDVGASTTPLQRVLHRKASAVIAVDTDKQALVELARSGLPVFLVEASAEALPIRTDSAGAVLMLDVLEHVADEEAAIREVHRILRPEGWLVLSVPHKGAFAFLDPQNLKARFDGRFTAATSHRHYSLGDLKRIFGQRFNIVRYHYGGLLLQPLLFAADNAVRKYLHRDWGWVLKRIGDLENTLSFGRFSYNVILLARKQ